MREIVFLLIDIDLQIYNRRKVLNPEVDYDASEKYDVRECVIQVMMDQFSNLKGEADLLEALVAVLAYGYTEDTTDSMFDPNPPTGSFCQR